MNQIIYINDDNNEEKMKNPKIIKLNPSKIKQKNYNRNNIKNRNYNFNSQSFTESNHTNNKFTETDEDLKFKFKN